MHVKKLKDMDRGWFVGNFIPVAYSTGACEVAVKSYHAGDYEEKHLHKIATEITVILEGSVVMFGQNFKPGDIIICEPGDATDFKALTDAKNVVVKVPGVRGDKYIVTECTKK